ncbi:MAG: hypothetical protein KIH62_003795 [Candidatus Kerfeldbacteria bacterium]|nr:hypothetical protein [Candidatus Kerfeldbacteria bacterium]
MIPAAYRFIAVFITGAVIAGGAFYFSFVNFNGEQLPGETKEEAVVTSQTFSNETITFQYPSVVGVESKLSAIDTRVTLIDVKVPGQAVSEPLPLRIQILPKQTKVACDKLKGVAGNPIAVGVTNVQPCMIPNGTADEGTTLRIEITRENFTALFLSDRYDVPTISNIVNGILATVTWNKQ